MLLRWLVNQYLRDAAEQKMRGMVEDVLSDRPARQRASGEPRGDQPRGSDPRRSEPSRATVDADHVSDASPVANAAAGLPQETDQTADADAFLPCDVLFLFAMGIESGGLVDSLKGVETTRLAHGIERAGKLDGREVAIVESGVGQKAAARAARAAIEFYQPRWVVSAGFAGALAPELRRGHVLLADRVSSETGSELQVGIKLAPETVAATKGLHVGRLLTVDRLIRQPEERTALGEKHAALACDMESYAVAEVCRDLGAKLISVRIISDAVDDTLPPEVENLLGQRSLAGKLGAAAGAMFRRPSAAKDLWNLREDALKASDRLAKFLRGIVGQLD
jgi:adenosylhomocysteine nucleosidase